MSPEDASEKAACLGFHSGEMELSTWDVLSMAVREWRSRCYESWWDSRLCWLRAGRALEPGFLIMDNVMIVLVMHDVCVFHGF